MAVYDFQCKACDNIFERISKIADRDNALTEICENCGESGHIKLVILQSVGLADPVRIGIRHPPAGFNEVLKGVKKANPRSTINIHGN